MDTHSISPPNSLNSCSRESEDINSKYQRLAAQYAQLRAQVVVLKKGLLDEREKHGFIKNNDVGKAQKIRSLEQEVDSLGFRNKQLSKRVDTLQQDLDVAARSKGKGKPGKGNSDISKDIASIHYEELESKIRENEILHSKIQTIEDRYKSRVRLLEEENMALNESKISVNKVFKVSKDEFELLISKEQRKSSTLQVQVDKIQKRLDAANSALQKSRASDGTDKTTDRKRQRTRNEESLNIYAKDKKRSILIEQTLNVMSGYVSDYVTSLLNYCTYVEQRTQMHSTDVGEALTQTSRDLCALLLENPGHIRPLNTTLVTFLGAVRASNYSLKSCTGLSAFSAVHSEVSQYLVNVFTLLKQSLSEESMLMSCSIQMEECNATLSDTIQPVIIALQNTASSLANVALVGDSSAAGRYLPLLVSDMKELCGVLRAHLSATHPKLILCHKLPTVTQRLKTTDECAVASLQSYVNTLTKIYHHLEDSLPLLTKPSRFTTERESLYASALAGQCVTYMGYVNSEMSLTADSTPSSPTPTLRNVSPDVSSELTKSKEKITKLEQSKEHWMLEAQLLNIKLEKLQKQLKEADQVRFSSSGNTDVSVDTLLDLSESDNSIKSVSPWDDSGLREEAIRQHYTNRVRDMSETIQKTEGACLVYKRECLGLKKRLLIAEKQQNQGAIDMCNIDVQKRQLEDELALTNDKYESQIALMSEHLCAMNDKLVSLNEANLHLKLQGKSGKK